MSARYGTHSRESRPSTAASVAAPRSFVALRSGAVLHVHDENLPPTTVATDQSQSDPSLSPSNGRLVGARGWRPSAVAAAPENERGEGRASEREESKWTNISQMVALLFVTVAAGACGARALARPTAQPACLPATVPPTKENRGRFSPQIANSTRATKTRLPSCSFFPPHSRPSLAESDMNLTTSTTTNNNTPAPSPLLQHKDSSGKMSPVATALPLPLLKPNPAVLFSAMQQSPPPESPPTTTAPISLATLPPPPPPPASAAASAEQLRLQQLYTLALADRMRFLHPAAALLSPYSNSQSSPPGSPSSPVGPVPPRGLPPPPPPPPDLHHPLYPYGKFDPRLFRLPEEPKPQHSYIGLISMAILSSAEHKLVLADIYQYILDNFAYFRHRGPGWRNSIRHNLSLNDCFIKSGRAANGKGHYWAIHPACIEDFKKGDYRRRKAQRKVRRHMGLAVDEEDSPSPPPPPPPLQASLQPPHGPMFSPVGMAAAAAAAAGWPFPFSHQAAALAALHARTPAPPPPPHPLSQPHMPTPPSILPPNLVAPVPLPPALNLRAAVPPSPPPPPQSKTSSSKRQFDVASLLGNTKAEGDEFEKREDEESTVAASEKRMRQLEQITVARGIFRPPPDDDDVKAAAVSEGEDNDNNKVEAASASDNEDDNAEANSGKANEESDSAGSEEEREKQDCDDHAAAAAAVSSSSFPWRLSVPPPPLPPPAAAALMSNGLPAHEYLARYYQLMQQNQQRMQNAASDAAASNAGYNEDKK